MDTYAETRKPKGKEVIHGANPSAVARIDKYKHQVELAPIEGGCKAARLTMPPWPGSNVSCQSPRAFLPPNPKWICFTKENLSAGLDVSIMVITVGGQRWIALNLAFLGKGQRPFCFLPVAMIYRKAAALAFNHFPTHPSLACPPPCHILYFAHSLPRDKREAILKKGRWTENVAGPRGWVCLWGLLCPGLDGGLLGFQECSM